MGSTLKQVCEAHWSTIHPDEGELGEWVRSQRSDGESWRAIGAELYKLTDGKIDLATQTLLNWYGESSSGNGAAA